MTVGTASGAVDPSLVRGALSAVTNDLAHHFDPARQVDYDKISYCPGLRGTAPILDLLIQSPPVMTSTIG